MQILKKDKHRKRSQIADFTAVKIQLLKLGKRSKGTYIGYIGIVENDRGKL